MKLTQLKSFNATNENTESKGKAEWYLSCGMLSLFFFGLLAVLGIIFTIFGKIILAMFLTDL